jgi:hypothetical protein
MMPDKVKTAVARLSNGQQRALKFALGALVGGILGYGYYAIVGCSTGACPITSDPMISTGWGAVIGGFAAAG